MLKDASLKLESLMTSGEGPTDTGDSLTCSKTGGSGGSPEQDDGGANSSGASMSNSDKDKHVNDDFYKPLTDHLDMVR